MGCCCSCFSLRRVYIERMVPTSNSDPSLLQDLFERHVEPKFINIDQIVSRYKRFNCAGNCLLKDKTRNIILSNSKTFREQDIGYGSHILIIRSNEPCDF